MLSGISKVCPRQNSMASYWNHCKTFSNCFQAKLNCTFLKTFKTFPKCVLVEIQLHHAEKIVRYFQICLSRNPIASYLRYSMTFSACVLAEIRQQPIEIFLQTFSVCVLAENQLHCTETILRHFKTVSRQKFNCIIPEIF